MILFQFQLLDLNYLQLIIISMQLIINLDDVLFFRMDLNEFSLYNFESV